jgi:hypothetical protein
MSPKTTERGGGDRRGTERDDALEAMLAPAETVVAWDAVVVTDCRVLFAWRGLTGWHADGVEFDEISRWTLGRRHDERPLVRLEHPTHFRTERVPAHRFLSFAWGNAEAEVPHTDVTLVLGSRRVPSYRALVERLERLEIPRGDDFVVEPPGTRADRTKHSVRRLFQT